MSQVDLLLPRPHRAEELTEPWRPPAGGLALPEAGASVQPALDRLAQTLSARGLSVLTPAVVPPGPDRPQVLQLSLAPGQSRGPESYRLEISPRGVTIAAGGDPGLAYGLATLEQWVRIHSRPSGAPLDRLPGLRVEDWPAFAQRGVLLDVSRDKVPTLETLLELIDLLAASKINQLQLYIEHTFAYHGHEVVWRDASPLTPEDVRQLDAYCRSRSIELVPNQNSFGHLHRWLRHEPYRHLAECPEGVEHPWSDEPEPFSLCPIDPGSLELLADLYDQLLPNFSSSLFNVGCDETFDLGLCRSAAACAERGRERVYLDFLREVHRLAAERGRRIQFWGDIILRAPELLAELPQDVVALEWGYEADHPFAERAASYAAAGREFLLAPGTSSWCSLLGRTRNMVGNLAAAARTALEYGAAGLLVTDWGDHGHLQPLPVSAPGLLAGAEVAWRGPSEATELEERLPAWLDLHAFTDEARRLGGALLDLGNAYLDTGARNRNGTALFFLLLFPDEPLESDRLQGLSREGLTAASDRIEAALERAAGARMERPDAELIADEIAWAGALLHLGAHLGIARLENDGVTAALPAAVRQELARELRPLVAEHRELWLARNRPGGLADSARRLEGLLRALEAL